MAPYDPFGDYMDLSMQCGCVGGRGSPVDVVRVRWGLGFTHWGQALGQAWGSRIGDTHGVHALGVGFSPVETPRRYVLLFSIAWPLTAVCAAVNNVLEVDQGLGQAVAHMHTSQGQAVAR